jgi:hypothetical protein
MVAPNPPTSPYSEEKTPEGIEFVFSCAYCGLHQSAVLVAIPGGLAPSSPAWEGFKKGALTTAFEKVKANFKHCYNCSTWVCWECWNAEAESCLGCTPIPGIQRGNMGPTGVTLSSLNFPLQMPFAGTTGVELSDATCPQCGNPLVKDAKFCSNCGAKV